MAVTRLREKLGGRDVVGSCLLLTRQCQRFEGSSPRVGGVFRLWSWGFSCPGGSEQPWGAAVEVGDPAAAQHATAGSAPLASVHCALVLSDGAARPVADFGKRTWTELLDIGIRLGAGALVALVRELEPSQGSSRPSLAAA